MKNVRAISKRSFDNLMKDSGLVDQVVSLKKNLYLISINFSSLWEDSPEEAIPYFKQDHENVLRLFFDDVIKDTRVQHIATKEWTTAKAFTKEDANKIIEFLNRIDKNSDDEIIVHCLMGKSRSVAVAHFICEFFGENPSSIYVNEEMKPNPTVLNLLREANI